MTLYIGVDFHPHQQTVSYCETKEGEVYQTALRHNPAQVRGFYAQFTEAVVGIEASGLASWFEQLMHDLGHELLVGNPRLIRARARSRHKSDKRDADLILDLLLKNEFPALWRRTPESQSVIELLRFRRALVTQRTQVCNRLQALAHGAGLPKRKLQSRRAREALLEAALSETQSFQRAELFGLLDELTVRIERVEQRLNERAETDERVRRVRSHTGVGLLSGLALVHTLGDVSRFSSSKQVVAFVGLDPLERSSAGKTRTGAISKAGSPLLRELLGHAMHSAVRFDGELRAFYKRLAKRRSKSIAKVAATRKLLIRLFIMLRDGIDYAAVQKARLGSRNTHPVSRSEMTVF
jgi:transposase